MQQAGTWPQDLGSLSATWSSTWVSEGKMGFNVCTQRADDIFSCYLTSFIKVWNKRKEQTKPNQNKPKNLNSLLLAKLVFQECLFYNPGIIQGRHLPMDKIMLVRKFLNRLCPQLQCVLVSFLGHDKWQMTSQPSCASITWMRYFTELLEFQISQIKANALVCMWVYSCILLKTPESCVKILKSFLSLLSFKFKTFSFFFFRERKVSIKNNNNSNNNNKTNHTRRTLLET